jgi:membrane glycosyltransferase
MGYVASPLWMLFLMISSIHTFREVVAGSYRNHHSETYASFFGYTVEVPQAFALFLFTLLLLFLPKVISVISEIKNRRAAAYGGPFRLAGSAMLEVVVSTLLAPVNMMFNTKFVLYILLGQGVAWVTQRRDASEDTDWREAIITHAGQMAFGVVWGVSAFILVPSFFWWLSPVLAGLVLSAPLSIFLGKASFGRRARELGLFLTPDETEPPEELLRLQRHLEECYRHMQPIPQLRADYGLLQAVLDPYVNAAHVSLLRQRQGSHAVRSYFVRLRRRLLSEGPENLTHREKMALLLDAESMIWLHEQLWKQPAERLSEWWRLAMRQYNVLTATPVTALYR